VVTRRAGALLLVLVVVGALGSCTIGSFPGTQATLQPTLQLRQVDGGSVAFQAGQPVPDFGMQPRPRIDLAGQWRFQPAARLDQALTFGDRGQTRRGLTAEAGNRPATGSRRATTTRGGAPWPCPGPSTRHPTGT
jgi:hypothetical protein